MPLGRVPWVYLASNASALAVLALAKALEARWPMKVWLPSVSIRVTPPRASAAHSVPSRSARMHSGRCRSCPM